MYHFVDASSFLNILALWFCYSSPAQHHKKYNQNNDSKRHQTNANTHQNERDKTVGSDIYFTACRIKLRVKKDWNKLYRKFSFKPPHRALNYLKHFLRGGKGWRGRGINGDFRSELAVSESVFNFVSNSLIHFENSEHWVFESTNTVRFFQECSMSWNVDLE